MHGVKAADDWEAHWQSYGASAAFNPAQEFRRQLILKLAGERALEASRVLDIGSGQGDLARDLRAQLPMADILGLELSAAGVEIASAAVRSARFLQYDLLAEASPPEDCRRWATVAVCSEVLEHVDDPEALLRRARALMAPECFLIVTVPGGPMSAFDRYIGHRRHYSPETLRVLLRRAGFQVEFAAGAGFPFFNLYRLAVVARGARLIERAKVGSVDSLSALERMLLAIFRWLFRWNRTKGGWGWQVIAGARLKASQD